jgi:hypothetical protein
VRTNHVTYVDGVPAGADDDRAAQPWPTSAG